MLPVCYKRNQLVRIDSTGKDRETITRDPMYQNISGGNYNKVTELMWFPRFINSVMISVLETLHDISTLLESNIKWLQGTNPDFK